MPTVKSGGVEIYYEVTGSGPPALLIGGVSTDITETEGLVASFARRMKVVAFDNRGTGRSGKPDVPYSVEEMADDAYAVLNASGVTKADVVGVSLGGRIAIALTLKHPEAVRRLVLASTGARLPRNFRRRLLLSAMEIPRRVGAYLSRYPQPAYAYRRQREASQGYDATGRLGEIRAPTLILHGRKDRFAPLGLAEEMHRLIPGSKMKVVDGGHHFVFVRPGEFVETVVDFLAN